MDTPAPAIIYTPPADDAVDRLVEEASARLAVMSGDTRYLDPDVMWGLSEFIKLIGRIKARQLNEAQASAFDNPENLGYPIETYK